MVMEEQQSDMELDSERVPVPQVQKAEEESCMEPNNKGKSFSRGKPRLRKKALHAAILKQMEFYFSDANLSKDRFLRNLIEENPYVDLNIFIRFNKIRELTTDTTRIAKALEESTMLSLSEDGSKVGRVTPVTLKENTDDCTIYVQNLPPDADHEMLITMFSQYGQVAYVSVPRYKSNKKIKGFAFVEFENPEDAKKCLKSFRKKGCVLPSNTLPNDLLSITTFDNADKDVTMCGKSMQSNQNNMCTEIANDTQQDTNNESTETKRGNDEVSTDKNLQSNEEQKSSKTQKKRKQNDSLPPEEVDTESAGGVNPEDGTINHKKKKQVDDTLSNDKHENLDSDEFGKMSTKRVRLNVSDIENKEIMCREDNENLKTEDTSMDIDSKDEQDTSNDKKKRRKRKRRSRIEDVSYTMGLQIMAKKDWKLLRNKYLDLQRSKMKQLKQHLRKTRWNQWSNYEKNKPEKEDNEEKEKSVKQENTAARYTFTPGVIVKIDMDKPCTDPKSFKMELRGNSAIQYIDIEEGSYHAYIRCDTAEAAQAFAQKSTEERQMTILQDEEERMYWDKIAQDREEKLGKKVRVKQRGRNKLLKKAEKELGKHIKFDEV